jgi:hypothetical protein
MQLWRTAQAGGAYRPAAGGQVDPGAPPSPRGQVLGLATEALTKPEESIWLPKKSTPQGPPDELFPGDLDDAGLPVEEDGVEEEPGEPFFDELPVDDWAA